MGKKQKKGDAAKNRIINQQTRGWMGEINELNEINEVLNKARPYDREGTITHYSKRTGLGCAWG